MIAAKCVFVFFLIVFLLDIQPTYGKGGRGGGGSRGGSRGSSSGSRGSSSSSSGSRGSSSSSSSSHGTSSQGSSSSSGRGQYDYSSSSNNKPSQPKPSVDLSQPVRPSAPELPKVNPSAPKLPQSSGNSQPSNPQPYNPNFGQPGRPGPGVSQVNPPPYGNVAPGNPPPYGVNQGHPSGGNPPPYAPHGNPPPYGPQGNPPPYAPHGNPPPYAPQGNPPPYGVNPGVMPQAPPPYGVNRPNLPQGNPPPYGVNPGMGPHVYPPGHGVHVGNVPHGGQPPYNPYPRQPGMVYPPAGVGSPTYFGSGNPSIKPHQKKGLFGGLLSLGKSSHKKQKYHGIGGGPMGSFGKPSFGGNRISPVHMLLPVMAMKKPHTSFFGSNHHYWILPYAAYRAGGFGGYHIYDDNYTGRCFRPRAPEHGSIGCESTMQGMLCIASCREGYVFPDNSTTIEAKCWRYSGHWSRSRYLPPCKPYCKEECQNGGTCKIPGLCRCNPEYRGDHCQHHVMKCDVIKLAAGSKISWVCSHTRNETLCKIKCRPPLEFESPPPAEQYHCHINGTWTPDRIPLCIEGGKSTEGIQNVSITTTPKEEDVTK